MTPEARRRAATLSALFATEQTVLAGSRLIFNPDDQSLTAITTTEYFPQNGPAQALNTTFSSFQVDNQWHIDRVKHHDSIKLRGTNGTGWGLAQIEDSSSAVIRPVLVNVLTGRVSNLPAPIEAALTKHSGESTVLGLGSDANGEPVTWFYVATQGVERVTLVVDSAGQTWEIDGTIAGVSQGYVVMVDFETAAIRFQKLGEGVVGEHQFSDYFVTSAVNQAWQAWMTTSEVGVAINVFDFRQQTRQPELYFAGRYSSKELTLVGDQLFITLRQARGDGSPAHYLIYQVDLETKNVSQVAAIPDHNTTVSITGDGQQVVVLPASNAPRLSEAYVLSIADGQTTRLEQSFPGSVESQPLPATTPVDQALPLIIGLGLYGLAWWLWPKAQKS